MIKQKTFLTLDTETCGLPPQNLVYDIGWTIHNKAGDIVTRRNFLARDIITNPAVMMGAFYAKKIFSFYIPALDLQTVRLASWSDIVATLAADVVAHNVDCVTAYNARFDVGAIRATNKALGITAKILPRPVDILCIWQFACTALLNRSSYHRLAAKHGWISDAGNVRTTAEHTYRYITGNADFVEGHTALSDAEIETDILAYCFRQKKPIPYNDLSGMPWQKAQQVVA
jgi:DNA polymerase III epsilon subunit-like protein